MNSDSTASGHPDPALEALLEYIKRSRGFDFTGYKHTGLARRIRKRMQALKLDSYTEYLDRLQVDPEEFIQLFNTILINVTGFFRDPAAWEYVAAEIVPRILRAKGEDEPIRAWSAGCATGEEAYSAAIVLAEALGPAAFRERVKIYATDADEEALARGRSGTYALREMPGLPPEQIDRYFDSQNGRYVFNKDLRRSVIFGRHDLIQDAPISRIDLLLCRNTLMYFNAETQSRILARLRFALSESGFLFLGKSEMLLTQGSLFAPVSLRYRVFAAVPKESPRDRLLLMAQAGSEEAVNHLTRHVRLRDSAFDESPIAQLVVDVNSELVMVNGRAGRLFGLSSRDVGRPLRDLELSYRPVELRSLIEQAIAERRSILAREIEWVSSPLGSIYLDVHVAPLQDAVGGLIGTMVAYEDVTRYRALQVELKKSHEELETAYEELQSTNEELETTNEELQSTIEELETTNEELQSTNEELETMNEELQ